MISNSTFSSSLPVHPCPRLPRSVRGVCWSLPSHDLLPATRPCAPGPAPPPSATPGSPDKGAGAGAQAPPAPTPAAVAASPGGAAPLPESGASVKGGAPGAVAEGGPAGTGPTAAAAKAGESTAPTAQAAPTGVATPAGPGSGSSSRGEQGHTRGWPGTASSHRKGGVLFPCSSACSCPYPHTCPCPCAGAIVGPLKCHRGPTPRCACWRTPTSCTASASSCSSASSSGAARPRPGAPCAPRGALTPYGRSLTWGVPAGGGRGEGERGGPECKAGEWQWRPGVHP